MTPADPRRRVWLAFTGAALAAAAFAQEQSQRSSFRTGVQLVRIDVTVLDGKRQPVGGLQASDFTVLEDGQSRPVRALQFVERAAAPADASATAITAAS